MEEDEEEGVDGNGEEEHRRRVDMAVREAKKS